LIPNSCPGQSRAGLAQRAELDRKPRGWCRASATSPDPFCSTSRLCPDLRTRVRAHVRTGDRQRPRGSTSGGSAKASIVCQWTMVSGTSSARG